ncbi:MAG: hypothetical protein M3281_09880, partial [Chloroflexota bacterium]|nr:hypothetical protein [Chloroflexota bacterium]
MTLDRDADVRTSLGLGYLSRLLALLAGQQLAAKGLPVELESVSVDGLQAALRLAAGKVHAFSLPETGIEVQGVRASTGQEQEASSPDQDDLLIWVRPSELNELLPNVLAGLALPLPVERAQVGCLE